MTLKTHTIYSRAMLRVGVCLSIYFSFILVSSCKKEIVADSRDAAPLSEGPQLKSGEDETPGSIFEPKIEINNGDEFTFETEVELNLSVVGAAEAYVTNVDGCEEGGEWQNYGQVLKWELGQNNSEAVVYAKFRSRRKSESPCVTASIIHDNTGPKIPDEIDDGSLVNSKEKSPPATWLEASDGLGSGLKGYKIAVGTKKGLDDILPWADIGVVNSFVAAGLALELDKTYFTSVRAYDLAGNDGPVNEGDGWLVTEWRPHAFVKFAGANPRLFGTKTAVYRDRIAVGMPGDKANQNYISKTQSDDRTMADSGSVSIYRRITDKGWELEAYVKASNVDHGDRFGASIDISYDTLVVGAPSEDSNLKQIVNATSSTLDDSSADSGAVYVYRRQGAVWVQEAFIKADNADAGDLFGSSVAIEGDFLVVGAPGEDSGGEPDDNTVANTGAAYVFARTNGKWKQMTYLKAPNPFEGDEFGYSVDVSESVLVVGAPKEDGGVFALTQGGKEPAEDTTSVNSGAAYVYISQGTSWEFNNYLKGLNGEGNDLFGYEVAIESDNLIVVGAPREDGIQGSVNGDGFASVRDGASDAGAAYVFMKKQNMWEASAYLKASNAESGHLFATSIDISEGRVVVGAPGENSSYRKIVNIVNQADTGFNGLNWGAAYVFSQSELGWEQEAYIKAVNAGGHDKFGSSVAISQGTIVSGAPAEQHDFLGVINAQNFPDNNKRLSAGAAYIYSLDPFTLD